MSEEKVLTKEIIIQEVPKFDDVVDLSEYTKIDDDAAELLSQFEGDVSLNGLTELSDISAGHLTNGQIFSLEFNGLTEYGADSSGFTKGLS
ncbi:hypothetical protein OAO16_02415 [Opitutales bacterium]|nr:hypothetical protein [Opitutales bacterium]